MIRYKDSERQSTSLYNQNAPSDPHVDFRKFLADNESIVNQDLVAWITTGLMHIPHSEDIPTTPTTGSTAGFLILPFNYFDEDPSMGSTNAVFIKPIDSKYTASVNRFGTPTGPSCVPRNYTVSFDGRYGH
jgi:diamine oxidase